MGEKFIDGPDPPPGEVTELRPKPKSKYSGTGVGRNGNLHPQPAPPWQKGIGGNPLGKGGARRRFSAAYLSDFSQVWAEGGIEALAPDMS